MSSGGGFAPSQRNLTLEGSSNVATNVSPTTSQTAPAPSGGKGGYNNSPMTMEDFAQQTPQVYMPPAQPTFYDQAFTNSYYNSGFQRPRMDYGLGGMGNAYARRMPMYSPSSPVEAQPPRDEMNLAPGGFGPGQLISQERPLNPDDFRPLASPSAAREVRAGPDGLMPGQMISDSWFNRRPGPTPVAATQSIRPEPNYSGGLGSLSSGISEMLAGRSSGSYVPQEGISTHDRRFNPMTGTSGPSKTVYTNDAQPLDWINTPNGRLWNA